MKVGAKHTKVTLGRSESKLSVKETTVTISLIELARLTNDWSSLYDVCCRMNSALEQANKRIEELEQREMELMRKLDHCIHPGCCCVCGHKGVT
jgi:hypothetical protein